MSRSHTLKYSGGALHDLNQPFSFDHTYDGWSAPSHWSSPSHSVGLSSPRQGSLQEQVRVGAEPCSWLSKLLFIFCIFYQIRFVFAGEQPTGRSSVQIRRRRRRSRTDWIRRRKETSSAQLYPRRKRSRNLNLNLDKPGIN